MLVFLPGAPFLGADRAFHIDPFAAAVGAGAGLELRNLVALAAGGPGLIHAIGLGNHDDARGKPGSALVAATARHELERGAVAKLQRLDAPAAAAAATLGKQLSKSRLLDSRQNVFPP